MNLNSVITISLVEFLIIHHCRQRTLQIPGGVPAWATEYRKTRRSILTLKGDLVEVYNSLYNVSKDTNCSLERRCNNI